MKIDVIVIGGGPAGMMAALAAADHTGSVLLLEKGPRPGRKLLLTGNGRCNVTNSQSVHQFITDCGATARFLRNAFGRFANADTVRFFESRGLPLALEQQHLYFPRAGGAAAVLAVLERELAARRVTVVPNAAVSRLRQEANDFTVFAATGEYHAAQLVIATGGRSYPLTGSNGDGYGMAGTFGHTIVAPRPGNVPLLVADRWLPQLQGVSIAPAVLSLASGSMRHSFPGGLMFTHYGISGPAAFDASRLLPDASAAAPVAARIDLIPGLPGDRLDRRLVSEAARHGRKTLKGLTAMVLPERLALAVLRLAGCDPASAASQLTSAQRAAIVTAIKQCPITIIGTRGFHEAMVTMGGVDTREIDPLTMESRRVPGLYFCGEVLDLDGPCGGYNLQIAWTTGFAAGTVAAHGAGSSR